MARDAGPPVTELKFCVKRIKLEDVGGKAHADREDDEGKGSAEKSGGNAKAETSDKASESDEGKGEKKEDDSALEAGELRFAPGLIDASSGQAIAWGIANVPTGFKLAKLRVKVKKDKTLCGVDYSVAFNGQTTDQDVEFRFRFDPPIDLDANTKAIEVSLDEAVSSLRAAAAAGNLASLKEHIEGAEGGAHRGGEDHDD